MNMKDRRKFSVFFVIVFFLFFLHTSINSSFNASFPIDSERSDSSTLHEKQSHNSLDYMSSEVVPNSFIRNSVPVRMMRENKEEVKLNCLLNLFAIAFAIVLFPILIYGTARYLVKGCLVTLWRITIFLHKSDGKKKGSYTILPME